MSLAVLRDLKEQRFLVLREKRIRASRKSLWDFCKTLHPDFYKPHYHHLKDLCDTLQALFEGNLKDSENNELLRLIINFPPQHGKSRTLVLFCCWVLGVQPSAKILTVSYNEGTATDFSKYCRDELIKEKNELYQIVYSDVFETTVKHGSASYRKWAVNGQHFSYLGCGIDGSLTSKGFTLRIIDDPYKGLEQVNSPLFRQHVIKFYTGTFLSRRASNRVLDIVNMTRWHVDDLCGYIKKQADSKEWYEFKRPAIDENGNMLCEDMLNKKNYEALERQMDAPTFSANYKGIAIHLQNKLYNLKVYYDIPRKSNGQPNFERILNHNDTADHGEDYLCGLVGGLSLGFIYLVGDVTTQLPQDVTVGMVSSLILRHNVNLSRTESNNGGEAFAKNVEKEVRSKGNTSTTFEWYHQSGNKEARIITNASTVNNIVLVPHDWQITMPTFYALISEYNRVFSSNKFHDGADCLTSLVEMSQVDTVDMGQFKSHGQRDFYEDVFNNNIANDSTDIFNVFGN